MAREPEEPKMVGPSTRERYCTVNRTHPTKRIITSDNIGHIEKAHCASPTCSWCASCFTLSTGRTPA